MKKKKYPHMTVPGVGTVEVDRLPKRVPKTVTVLGGRHKVSPHVYKTLWAVKHATPNARRRLKKL